jgi:DNA-binding transcriptional LysR family regulator
MELQRLHCALAVAEELHFARAAEKLHIEQLSLSRASGAWEADAHECPVSEIFTVRSG